MVVTAWASITTGPGSWAANGSVMEPPAGMVPPVRQTSAVPSAVLTRAGATLVSCPSMTVPGRPVHTTCTVVAWAAWRVMK